MRRAFVLLSGGIDSTTCLYKAIHDFAPKHELVDSDPLTIYPIWWVEAISINYGQRHLKETQYAAVTCDTLGITHTVLNLKDILGGPGGYGTMLTDSHIPIPDIDYADIKGVSPTYVPFRNGTLLSLITAHAQKWVNNQIETLKVDGPGDQELADSMKDSAGIYFGAHAEDAANWAYPDCTPEFIGAMANAIYIGTYQTVRLHTPLQWLGKKEIIQLGEQLTVDWKNTWSCYAGGETHCGTCPTCRARKAGFAAAGVDDPTKYGPTKTPLSGIAFNADDIPF
jgi:7-cyano-7-deazaguanine synthase